MPLLDTTGNVSADAYAGGTAVAPVYIEQIFSTWLYTGTGATQTITNGIDLSTKGGMTWIKSRSAATNNCLFDTVRGATKYLGSNTTTASTTDANGLTAFNTTGFTLGTGGTTGDEVNVSAATYASWTFRKQPKFFDVVTYTGTGSLQNISHNLGSVPGCIIIKCTTTDSNWITYHRGLSTPSQSAVFVNLNIAQVSSSGFWNNTDPTSTQFTVNTDTAANGSERTYIAYLFAHNAGGFGLTGTDNVISCGSYTGTGNSSLSVNLGYEPQWVLIKRTNAANDWYLIDSMRGFSLTSDNVLFSNTSDSEFNITNANGAPFPTATGIGWNAGGTAGSNNISGGTYIYIAIRRGPMKVPTSGTSVFTPQLARGPVSGTGSGSNPSWTTTYPLDLLIQAQRSGGYAPFQYAVDRLRGPKYLITSATNAESGSPWLLDTNIGAYVTSASYDTTLTGWLFARAPSFFDVVCYTGTGSQQNITHNLGIAPELMIVKRRSAAGASWATWATSLTADQSLALNTTDDKTVVFSVGFWGSTFPTASVFTVGTNVNTNSSGITYVAYLFASCPGVSKVGSYTGTGATQTISCGFTGGARFVMIKRTDSTGDWYVWDTARGMVAGTDPSILMNSTANEVNANSVYTTTGGFQIVSTDAGINASGGTYLYFSVA